MRRFPPPRSLPRSPRSWCGPRSRITRAGRRSRCSRSPCRSSRNTGTCNSSSRSGWRMKSAGPVPGPGSRAGPPTAPWTGSGTASDGRRSDTGRWCWDMTVPCPTRFASSPKRTCSRIRGALRRAKSCHRRRSRWSTWDIVASASLLMMRRLDACARNRGPRPYRRPRQARSFRHMAGVKQYETDVAIVGAGGAGIPAGIELREAGARVLVFEKGTQLGGAAIISGGGCLIVGSPLQEKHGIHDTPDLAFKDWIAWGGPSTDVVWARYYIEHSLHDLYHWAEGFGVKW